MRFLGPYLRRHGTIPAALSIMHRSSAIWLLSLFAGISCSQAQTWTPARFDMGILTVSNLWVDPVLGNNANSGASNAPLRTLAEAWTRVPMGVPLTNTGYRIWLKPGDYAESAIPGYWESRYGQHGKPVIVEASGGRGTARLHGYVNVFDCSHLYFVNIDVVTDPGYGGGGDVLHLERCSNVVIRGCLLNGFDGSVNQPQETFKANQSTHLYVEDSELRGAAQNVLDYVAVQYGHIVGCKLWSSTTDWVMYVKGGSAYLLIEGNEIFDGLVGGFTAGQGTGFEYMTNPWLHYEAVDIKFVNNVIHHTGIAGMGVNGGYNILLAHNTLYRVGTNDHLVEIVHGSRSCDGDTAGCSSNHNAGGWGGVAIDGQFIPCRNVYVYNNIFYNPSNTFQGWQHFTIFGPMTPPAGSNVGNPSRVDDGLKIRGNIIWSGNVATPLGIEDSDQGCQPGNPTCNETQLYADNAINTIEPQLVNPGAGDYRPVPRGSVYRATTFEIPAFPGGDRPTPPLAPVGALANGVPRERSGYARYAARPAGAYTGGSSIALDLMDSESGLQLRLLGETGNHYVVESGSSTGGWTSLVSTNPAQRTNVWSIGTAATMTTWFRARLLP